MATPKQIVRHGLMSYPSIFPTPLKVLDHLLTCIGNGYEWIGGELAYVYPDPSHVYGEEKMKYEDLEERLTRLDSYFPDLAMKYELEVDALRRQRQWTEENIDKILEADLLANYFSNATHPGGSYKTKNICTRYAKAIQFPDNITPAWRELLRQYLDHWLVALNYYYGVSNAKGDEAIRHWPEDIKQARLDILAAQARLKALTNSE